MIFRRLLLLFMTVLCAGNVRGAENYLRDSLLVQLETMPHDERRLDALYDLVRVTQSDIEDCRRFNKLLLEEADLQDNDEYRCRYYFTEVIFAYNTHDTKKLREVTNVLIPLARKNKFYGTMFRAWRTKIDFMILSQDLERNEQEANKMLAEAQRLDNKIGIMEAYQCLANIYNATYRKADATAILEKALILAKENGKLNSLKPIWQSLLAQYADSGKDYAKWIKLLEEAQTRIMELPPDQLRMQHLFLLIIYSNFTDYYTQIGNLERAAYYMHRAETYLGNVNSPLYIIYFQKACSRYYFKLGEYEKALERIDVAIEQLRVLSTGGDYYGILPEKARILNKMNRHKDAIRHLKESIFFKDSLQVVTINKQYQQLKKDFNADQLQIEEAELQHKIQIYTLVLLGIGLVVITGFVVYVLRMHQMLRNAEHQMRSMNRQMELVNEAKNRFLSNISTTIREPLNTVVEGSLRLADRQISDHEEQQQLSEAIRQKAASLLGVINDILDLSRLEAGMMKFEIVDADLTSLLFDAVCSPQIEVVSEYPANTLYMVRLDAGRLMQVFNSLMVPNKEHVTARLSEAPGNVFQIAVSGCLLVRKNPEQEIIIRNEINRMLIHRFGGVYTVEGQQIIVTIPIADKIGEPK